MGTADAQQVACRSRASSIQWMSTAWLPSVTRRGAPRRTPVGAGGAASSGVLVPRAWRPPQALLPSRATAPALLTPSARSSSSRWSGVSVSLSRSPPYILCLPLASRSCSSVPHRSCVHGCPACRQMVRAGCLPCHVRWIRSLRHSMKHLYVSLQVMAVLVALTGHGAVVLRLDAGAVACPVSDTTISLAFSVGPHEESRAAGHIPAVTACTAIFCLHMHQHPGITP